MIILTIHQKDLAEAEARMRVAQGQFVEATQAAADGDPLKARRLLAESLLRKDTPETRERLAAIWNVPVTRVWSSRLSSVGSPDAEHAPRHVAFVRGGAAVLIAGDSREVALLSTDDAHTLRPMHVDANVLAMAVSLDGRNAAFATTNKTIEIWDTENLKKMRTVGLEELTRQQVSSAYALAFSPGNLQLAWCSPEGAFIMPVSEPGKLTAPANVHLGFVASVAAIRTARIGSESYWCFGGKGGIASTRIHFPRNSNALQIDREDAGIFERFSPGFFYLIVLGNAQVPWITDIRGSVGGLGGSHDVATFDISADSRFLASWASDAGVNLTNLESGTNIQLGKAVGDTGGLAFSPDCRTLLACGRDGVIRFYDVVTGTQILALEGHTSGVACIAICPDGSRFVTVARDGTIEMWSMDSSVNQRMLRAAGSLSAVAWLSDQVLVSADHSGSLVRWDMRTLTPLACIAHKTVFNQNRFAVAPDRKSLWLVDVARTPHSVDSLNPFAAAVTEANNDPNEPPFFLWYGHDEESLNASGRAPISIDDAGSVLAVNHRGNLLAVADTKNGVQVRDPHANQSATIESQIGDPVRVLAFSPDDRILAAGTKKGRVLIWARKEAKPSTRMTLGTNDGSTRIWARSGTERLTQIVHAGSIRALNFVLLDGRLHLLIAAADHTVRLWDVSSGRQLYSKSFDAFSIATIPGALQFAAGGAYGSVVVFDLQTGVKRATFDGHSARVSSLSYSPNKRVLASASFDGTIRFWDVSFLRFLQTASPEEIRIHVGDSLAHGKMEAAKSPQWTEILMRVHAAKVRPLPTTLEALEAELHVLKPVANELSPGDPASDEAKRQLADYVFQSIRALFDTNRLEPIAVKPGSAQDTPTPASRITDVTRETLLRKLLKLVDQQVSPSVWMQTTPAITLAPRFQLLRGQILEALGSVGDAAESYWITSLGLSGPRSQADDGMLRTQAEAEYSYARLLYKIAALPVSKRPNVANGRNPIDYQQTWILQDLAKGKFEAAVDHGFRDWRRLIKDSFLLRLPKDHHHLGVLSKVLPDQEVLVGEILGLLQSGQYAMVRDLCDVILSLSPGFDEAYAIKGQASLGMHRYHESIIDFSNALASNSLRIQLLQQAKQVGDDAAQQQIELQKSENRRLAYLRGRADAYRMMMIRVLMSLP